MGEKVVWGAKWVKSVKTHFQHLLLTAFGTLTKTHFLTHCKGGGSCSLKRALRQSRFRIKSHGFRGFCGSNGFSVNPPPQEKRTTPFLNNHQGPLNGGVSNGGVSRSGLVLPFLSFLGLSRFFWDFPDLLGDGAGIFPIRPFPLSRPIKSTYEEQSRKGPRHNLDLSRTKWETPGFGNPPV